MKVKHMNALLMEILMAVIFFALASVVILNLFATGYDLSARADALDRAVNHARQISEQLYASENMAEALTDCGFTQAEDQWSLEAQDYALNARLFREETAAGVLWNAEISVILEDAAAVVIPCARYVAGEVEA